MGQLGFFDADKRLAAISAKGDPLEMIDRVVPFERFRAEIEAVVLTPAEDKKSSAGRKPIDVIVMFRMLLLQSLYNLSDEQVEYQVSDRMSFTRFLRLGIEDRVPDGTIRCTWRPDGKQRNSREENEAVKAGKTPKEWQKNPAKNRQREPARSWHGLLNKANTSADVRHRSACAWDRPIASSCRCRKGRRTAQRRPMG